MIFPSCKEVSHLASQGLDRRLGFAERLRLRAHLAICEGCRNCKRQMEFLRRGLEKLDLRERSAPGPRS